MSLFGFKTKYDIIPKVEQMKTLVTKYNGVDVIKMNAKFVVPEGYFFVVGKKGRATDKFDVGEYFFNSANLPYMCRKFGIDKIKHGQAQDKIPADFYFISKDLRAGMFRTYKKVEMGTKAYGMFSTRVKGIFSYRVTDAKEFMQSLLNEFDYIKTGEAEGMVNSWVGEVIVSELEGKNFMIDDIVKNSPIVVNALKERVKKLFTVAGLELVDFKIIKYDLPKQYQEESNKNLKMQNETIETKKDKEKATEKFGTSDLFKDADKQALVSPQLEELEEERKDLDVSQRAETTTLREHFIKGESDSPENLKKLFENFDNLEEVKKDNFTNSKETRVETDESKEKTSISDEYVPFGSFVISNAEKTLEESEKKIKPKKSFVDLSLNELYNNDEQVKRCLSCGAENDKSAKICTLCGEIFKEE